VITHRSMKVLMGLAVGVVFGAIDSSAALASTSSSACSAPTLSQPFLAIGDANLYSLMPGESVDSFTGGGWTLSGGAAIVNATLADGQTGPVLNLPSRATAVSPVVCVTSDYPQARTEIRDLVGAEGVTFGVEYLGTNTENSPRTTGQVHSNKGVAWDASTPVNLQPANTTGWQQVRIVLTANGKTSDFQVYNLYLDPRCKGT
jgi:hypothetical protein